MDTSGPRPCPAAAALDVLGERWSLLVLRELFYGVHRFDGIVRATGAPRNILTNRLRGLEEAGVVRRVRYQDRPPRFEYRLTDAGQDALPVVLSLLHWGEQHLSARSTAPQIRHRHGDGRPHRLRVTTTCETCGEPVAPDTLTMPKDDPWAGPAKSRSTGPAKSRS
ncbi:helix-turn-helix transcriptional regulator [Solihabitans fulvus]|uniref:Helix-turn-helix transcriptional regulator n=1 Tax=Solihabitans fulvus TaxID=1892852 RepID=A0A5B2WIK5_9PSEU|nr:helix-turn-helix domain-containing protein [Solihabitans fulvus]KAA2251235.1 helix-turn-helix transcriptional regulator [Solihabitans fulvus]